MVFRTYLSYDGFIIDPVYREMSYPFFGYKRICRGGAWCVPDYLVTKSYRMHNQWIVEFNILVLELLDIIIDYYISQQSYQNNNLNIYPLFLLFS